MKSQESLNDFRGYMRRLKLYIQFCVGISEKKVSSSSQSLKDVGNSSLHKWDHLKWPHYGVYSSQFLIWSIFINKYRINDCLKKAKKYLTFRKKQSYSVTLVLEKITLKQLTMQGYELWLPIKWYGWWWFKSCLILATPWTVACQAPLSMGFSSGMGKTC